MRLPFCTKSAPEIFHRVMESMIEGQQHDERLEKLLQKVKKNGLKLNRDKCLFGVTEMTFLGDKVTSEGV